ncbi:MAG: alpha/beta fold hydrolase [Myxococcota bacterium]
MSDTNGSPVSIPARDGFELAASLYPAAQPHRLNHMVVINSATAVNQRFYRRLAGHLSTKGFSALTYDYRGVAKSRPKTLRGFSARMRDWGLLDMAGVIDWVRREHAPDTLSLIGHSVGGQIAGLLDNAQHVDAMVTFSSQSGYWALQGSEQKAVVFLHAYVTMSFFARTLGYLPWSKFGGEDIPGGVALEWAKWCRNERYLLDDNSLPLDRYETFDAPVLAFSFDDDKWGTPKAVDAMMGAYPKLERRHIEPRAVGMKSIGHFGGFRSNASAIWDEAIEWLALKGKSKAN